jgi:hypothetical protein
MLKIAVGRQPRSGVLSHALAKTDYRRCLSLISPSSPTAVEVSRLLSSTGGGKEA